MLGPQKGDVLEFCIDAGQIIYDLKEVPCRPKMR